MAKIEGLILKFIPYKETSKILYVYTKDGLESVLVHGARKIKSPHLNLTQLMNRVNLDVTGKDLLILRDGDLIDDYATIKNDLNRHIHYQHLCEIVYTISRHEHDHAKLYLFLLKIFEHGKEGSYIPYVNMAELKILYLLGLQPMFAECVICGAKDHLRFSIEDGGMICGAHGEDRLFVDSHVVRMIMRLYYYDLQNPEALSFSDEDLKPIRRFIDRYYAYHLDFKSKSREIMQDLMGY